MRRDFEERGQGQVFAFWDRLDEAGRARLVEQAGEIDLDEVDRLVATLVKGSPAPAFEWERLEPTPVVARPEHGGDGEAWRRAREVGEAALRAGRVAAFTVAGGQGTRLGYDGPKGTYGVTPVRQKSLFQVFAERILAAGLRYGRPVPWVVMTSHQNHAATEAFFRERRYFGLDPAGVSFIRQGRMPAVDYSGRILLEGMDAIALSPDGHGGALRALVRSGVTARLAERGVDTISYFQVDNPLVRCVDPEFVGFHLEERSEMSSKTIPKAYPDEKLGHFCRYEGRLVVVEYSDLPKELQHDRRADGRLRFEAGSIAIHILDRDFVDRMGGASGPAAALPFHRADKKIPHVGADGLMLRPEKPNGVKFEMFVFDALPFAQRPVVVETARADEFSPVKNATGVDSPATCLADQLRQFARWANAQGAGVPVDATGLPAYEFEVAPSFGDDGPSFAASWAARRPRVGPGVVLE